jgi:hypothetical protein
MTIIKPSPFNGEQREMELPVTLEQLEKWQNGELIQRAMPHLTPDQREFLITGMLPGEFEKIFKPE